MPDVLLWSLQETARQLGGISPRTVRRLVPTDANRNGIITQYATAYRLGQHIPQPARLDIQIF